MIRSEISIERMIKEGPAQVNAIPCGDDYVISGAIQEDQLEPLLMKRGKSGIIGYKYHTTVQEQTPLFWRSSSLSYGPFSLFQSNVPSQSLCLRVSTVYRPCTFGASIPRKHGYREVSLATFIRTLQIVPEKYRPSRFFL
jgi:hypothetical protein